MDEFDKKALETLRYEFETMHLCKKYMQPHHGDNDFMLNAVLEAFLVHVRLIYAFFSKPPIRDDITVDDLIDDNVRWRNIEPNLFLKLSMRQDIGGIVYKKGWYDLIHKHLAHLSKARLSYKPSWPISGLYNECRQACVMFANCLNQEKRTWFSKGILPSS